MLWTFQVAMCALKRLYIVFQANHYVAVISLVTQAGPRASRGRRQTLILVLIRERPGGLNHVQPIHIEG